MRVSIRKLNRELPQALLSFSVFVDERPMGFGDLWEEPNLYGGPERYVGGNDRWMEAGAEEAVFALAEEAVSLGERTDREVQICDCCGAEDNGDICDGVCPSCDGTSDEEGGEES